MAIGLLLNSGVVKRKICSRILQMGIKGIPAAKGRSSFKSGGCIFGAGGAAKSCRYVSTAIMVMGGGAFLVGACSEYSNFHLGLGMGMGGPAERQLRMFIDVNSCPLPKKEGEGSRDFIANAIKFLQMNGIKAETISCIVYGVGYAISVPPKGSNGEILPVERIYTSIPSIDGLQPYEIEFKLVEKTDLVESKIILDMRNFVLDNPPSSTTILLVSGRFQSTTILRELAKRGYKILAAVPNLKSAGADISNGCESVWEWSEMGTYQEKYY